MEATEDDLKKAYEQLLAAYPAPTPVCVAENVLHDVKKHQMTILRDEGLHRHVRFAEPGTGVYWFELITWPGKLTISGDMGTFVFERVADMFTFFRSRSSEKQGLYINPDYWAEKCVAAERSGAWAGMKHWNAKTFKSQIAQWLVDAEVTEAVIEAAIDDVISQAEDGEHYATQAVMDFSVTKDGMPKVARKQEDLQRVFTFQDFWEVDCTEYTYSFLWCLYAIVWGIQQYDKHKAATALETQCRNIRARARQATSQI